MKLTIGHLYPDLLNLYGDRGNIQCMMKRLQWRGIEAETIEFEIQTRSTSLNLTLFCSVEGLTGNRCLSANV